MYDDQQYKADQSLIVRATFGAITSATNAAGTIASGSKIKFYQQIKLNAIRANVLTTPAVAAAAKAGIIPFNLKLTDGATNFGQVTLSTGTAADLITGTVKSASIPRDTELYLKFVTTGTGCGTKAKVTPGECDVHLHYQERWA